MIKNVLPLSFIVATRFFGLFIVLPVLSLYALNLDGADEKLVGFLIGIYAFMQMALQTPFGILSDKIGRKNALAIGLLIFIIGSIICAYSSGIYTMIFGRCLQGCGAVGAVATALISDFTKEEERGKAMSIMGAMIGIAFASAIVLSPILSDKFGLSSIFNLSTFLTLICLILLYAVVPKEPKITTKSVKTPFSEILKDKNLLLLNLSNFLQKMLMTTAFFIIPIILVNNLGFDKSQIYKIYITAMIFGLVAMGLSGALGEKRGLAKEILLSGIAFFIASYALFATENSLSIFVIAVILFFIGFNMHEPIMQSLASKFAKSHQKGSALGVFNSFGFLGSFVGGVFGGIALKEIGLFYLALVVVVLAVIWFVLLLNLTNPIIFKNLYFDKSIKADFTALSDTHGIIECYETEKKIIVKYNRKRISKHQILKKLGLTR